MNPILWQPDEERVKRSRMYRFLKTVNQTFELRLSSYAELHAWSVANLEDFWDFYRRWSGIRFSCEADETLSSRLLPGAHWFSGATLNYAENLLKDAPADKPALIGQVEGEPLQTMTYGELRQQAAAFAGGLRAAGVGPGDRVAGFMPNIPQTVAAFLGTASIGAVWTSCSPDFGPTGALDRIGQVNPKILVTVPAYAYKGKRRDLTATLEFLAGKISGLSRIVMVPFQDVVPSSPLVSDVPLSSWDEFLRDAPGDTAEFLQVPFEHPLCILYSSGTTGKPKCIVHGTGGTLLQHHKEHALHTDIGPDDVVFYFTTCGWMMWNWLVSVLAQQATVVLYEGCPGYPDLSALWKLVDNAGITVFGTSPRFLNQCSQAGLKPGREHRLHTLRCVLSTGSPLDRACFRYVYSDIKQDVQLASISGGTDIISCFFLGNPLLPVREEELQCIGLGMDVKALDSHGRPVLDQKGELACLSPAPSMPVGFWNDADGNKYRKAYFSKVPGVWIHGDYIEIKRQGGVIVFGRSDATLNPGGVRIGTAEIYRIVEGLEDVSDSLVVGLPEGNDVSILLFVVLRDNRKLTPLLQDQIKAALRRETTPRHVPDAIFQVREIPKTLNGKKMELTVRDLLAGELEINTTALANPGSLEDYRELFKNRMAVKAG